MDVAEKDDVPMLRSIQLPKFSYTHRSVSIPIPTSSTPTESNLVGFTGPLCNKRKTSMSRCGPSFVNRRKRQTKEGGDHEVTTNEHLLRSGQLGMCNDPYCTVCPTSYNYNSQPAKPAFNLDQRFHNVIHGDAKGWARKKWSAIEPYIFGVMNPHTKLIQDWNKFFVISCLLAIFIDPFFFYMLAVHKENKCIVINLHMSEVIVVFRSITDLIYFIHMLLQFRLAYVSPESCIVGAGELVDQPKKIALNYLSGFFLLDLFIVLPLPQMIILLVLRKNTLSKANHVNNLLRVTILIQYIPQLYRFMPFLAGQSPSGFIFESAWASFVINLLTFVLAAHVVGSCWYLFGLQRVNQCFQDACDKSGLKNCTRFMDCGDGVDHGRFEWANSSAWDSWKNDKNSGACLDDEHGFSLDDEPGFPYGIYDRVVGLSTKSSIITKYLYSFFWGFQQISTLAGNLTPSHYPLEVLFTSAIIGLGLLLFALLIGNIQNFLQGLGRRRLEMSLRRRDVEQWMCHRRLPKELRIKVREAERYNWAATRGVNEEMLMENLPEDLQTDIRRHLFKFIKKVRIFALLEEPILDAICERLRQRTYIQGGRTICQGGLVTKMVFIIRGKMESEGEDGNKDVLSDGDVCGEELITWCLEHSSVNQDIRKHRPPGHKLLSKRTIKCLTNVEAFVLRAADLEEVTSCFARFLRNPRVQLAIRNESPYWRNLAAKCIQVAWRLRKERLSHPHTSTCYTALPSEFSELLLYM